LIGPNRDFLFYPTAVKDLVSDAGAMDWSFPYNNLLMEGIGPEQSQLAAIKKGAKLFTNFAVLLTWAIALKPQSFLNLSSTPSSDQPTI